MKRTLLITDDFPPRVGGVAAYYGEICRRLPAEAITVLTVPAPGSQANDTQQAYAVVRRPLLSESAFVWPRWRAAVRAAVDVSTQKRVEVIWAGQILPHGTVAWVLHRRSGIPYIVTVHGMDIGIPRGRKRWLCQRILNNAQTVVANSQATKSLTMDKYGVPASKISVQTPGVAPACRVPQTAVDALRQRYGLRDVLVLLTVGRLVERKNLQVLVAALPMLRTALPNTHCVIVGNGPARPAIERQVNRLGLQDKVLLVGTVSADVLAAWYEASDIFVLAPKPEDHGDQEGFGMVYLEASSYGKPVVASDVPGVREAVADGVSGVLVEPNNPNALAAAIIRLGRDRTLAHRFGIQGQDRAMRQFGWQARATAYQRLLTWASNPRDG